MSGTQGPEGEKIEPDDVAEVPGDGAAEPDAPDDEFEEFNLDDIEVIESKVFG